MSKNFGLKLASTLGLVGFCFAAIYFTQVPSTTSKTSSSSVADAPTYKLGSFEGAKSVFDQRCIQCHSCNTAPCQLKLTSYEGVRRGLTQIQVYDPARLSEIKPTRLGVDAHGESAWQARGFYPVVTSSIGSSAPMLTEVLKIQTGWVPKAPVLSQHACPLDTNSYRRFIGENSDMMMPYGLPALSEHERASILSWVAAGAASPTQRSENLPSNEQTALINWQKILNKADLRSRLVSRYLYEHLFLAHIRFDTNSTQYFRLIRSRTLCGQQASEIATRRPTDDPGAPLYYCFQPLAETIVEKTHLPYLMDDAKLARIKNIFFEENWAATEWPGYANGTNPFLTFAAIPTKARYLFLLEDAKYHVATFIKGPVCNGNGAVNAIDEHFFVAFMDPSSELQVIDPAFARTSASILQLPAETGGKLELLIAGNFMGKYLRNEKQYKDLKEGVRRRAFPYGYRLTDIWDGDGTNPNALLTVFRHSENAEVLQGFQGGFSNSMFVLDYALFERLVYNLAVDFDVFGAVSHQLYTRMYMGLIRREAEDNVMSFIPSKARMSLYAKWEGMQSRLREKLFNFEPDLTFPSQIQYQDGIAYDQQFAQKLVAERYAPEILGTHDFVNTRYLNLTRAAPEARSVENQAIASLRAISQVPAKALPFVKFMPDSSLLIVQKDEKVVQVYTMIRNKAHVTIGNLFREEKSRDISEDNLVFVPGLATSYPNYFYVVSAPSLPAFVENIQTVTDPATLGQFKDRWGVARENDSFWKVSDSVHAFLKAANPTEFGALDYTRYGQ